MKLEIAQKIVAAALAAARKSNFKPLAVAVLDDRGALKAFAAEDGTSLKRAEIANGKAAGALAMGLGSRTLGTMAAQRPQFVAAVSHVVGGMLIPVAGGVLIRDGAGALLGAVGISGDTSDNDETAAVAGIESAGLKADPEPETAMPELPEVETVRLGLEPVLRGRRFINVELRRPDLRFPLPERFVERLTGRTVQRLERRAKYILVHLDKGEVLAVHLGMTGRFSVSSPSPRTSRGEGRGEGRRQTPTLAPGAAPHPNPLPAEERGEGTDGGRAQLGEYAHEHGHSTKHDHLVFTMSGGAVVTYNDARRFGYMTLVPESELSDHAYFAGLGVEPLSDALDPAYLAGRAQRKKVDLKALLMDQRIVAGLGNIYVCEALFRAGLDPFKGAASLATKTGKPKPAAIRLVAAIKAVLADAVRAGGSTLRDYKQADGSLGRFQLQFAVYGREGEPCSRPGCRGRVRRKTQGGRSTFYCPACQR